MYNCKCGKETVISVQYVTWNKAQVSGADAYVAVGPFKHLIEFTRTRKKGLYFLYFNIFCGRKFCFIYNIFLEKEIQNFIKIMRENICMKMFNTII